ncbi:MAG: GHMP kinase [Gemmatimonadaceae bacterium]
MRSITSASAPGRLDVMGGIADYSGSLVLQLPLDRRTTATVELRDDDRIEIESLRGSATSRITIGLDDFAGASAQAIAARYPAGSERHWAAYPLGVAHALFARTNAVVRGFTLRIASDVPEGKGVSSSAAIEVSSLAALASAFGVELSHEEIAHAAQWAENHAAGAPCGIMDQMTSACGRRDHLLRLRCQPAIIEDQIPIPAGYRFFGIDSGIRHAVTGADYGTVRTAAFMGLRIIDDDTLDGYLANLTPAQLARHTLPERMLGAEFLALHGGIDDAVTRVNPATTYPVRVAASHPVFENARVERFAELLAELPTKPDAAHEMGALMYASHEGYSACRLGSEGTDRIVEMVRARGLFGAKITGGGSGGTVAVFARDSEESIVREIASGFGEVFAGSSDGVRVTE